MVRVLAMCLVSLTASFTLVNAQAHSTPESRTKDFYSWYLKAMVKGEDPTKNKTVMNSHLSKRFSRSFYSKAGQDLDYDIFVNGQDWNEAWEGNINVGEMTIKPTTAVVNITLGAASDNWVMRLRISLIKEGATWKIDRVAAGSANARTTVQRPALPNELTSYVGQYPAKLMKVASVKSRLMSLLGKSFAYFNDSISVQSEISKQGDFLLASGCMAHMCASNGAAFVIDLENKRIHAAIYEEGETPQFFNEDTVPTPQILLNWMAEHGT